MSEAKPSGHPRPEAEGLHQNASQDDSRSNLVIEPATAEVLATVPRAGAAEVDEAVARAREAFPLWRDVAPG